MEKNYAVIFRRGQFVEGKGCSLEAVDYVEGIEKEIKGKKYFIIDPDFRERSLEELDKEEELYEFFENTKVLRFMENRSNITTKYVYGTPMNTRVLKDLIVYNFDFLNEAFGIKVPDEEYEQNVNNLKETYVTALKMYTFYQNINRNGEVETSCQRKEPLMYDVNMTEQINNIFTEELGLKFPDDYDADVDYEDMYKPLPTEIDIKTIYDEVRKYIKGQDKHIVPLLNAINDNLNAEIPEEKVNILVCGPTGCGKTAVIERIASLIGLPVKIEDSTQFTKAGYVGRDVSEAFEDLIEVANGDLELAQLGILIFDEADKKASKGTDDVSGQSVLQSMLKMLEGKDYTYETGSGISRKLRTFKTLNTTIVLSGAFSNLANTVSLKAAPGFGREEVKNTIDVVYGVDNLGEYGIPKECVGRLDLEIFDELSVPTLKEILTTGKVNPLELFIKKMKRRFNTNVVVTDEFVDALAQKAHDSGCGARSLYKEFRKATKIAEAGISLMDKNVQKELVLTPEMINDNTKFDVITDIKVKTLHR